MQVTGRVDLSAYSLPVFYKRIHKLVVRMILIPSSDSIILWSKSNKSFLISNQEKLIRTKVYSRLFCGTFEKFISQLKHYVSFLKFAKEDGLSPL